MGGGGNTSVGGDLWNTTRSGRVVLGTLLTEEVTMEDDPITNAFLLLGAVTASSLLVAVMYFALIGVSYTLGWEC